jgi:signal peptidase II
MTRARVRALALLLLVATTVGCDRLTKHLDTVTLVGTPTQSFLADTLRLEYVENVGAFLSLRADLPPLLRTSIFTIGAGLVLVGTVFAAVRYRWSWRSLVGLSLVLAGGA